MKSFTHTVAASLLAMASDNVGADVPLNQLVQPDMVKSPCTYETDRAVSGAAAKPVFKALNLSTVNVSYAGLRTGHDPSGNCISVTAHANNFEVMTRYGDGTIESIRVNPGKDTMSTLTVFPDGSVQKFAQKWSHDDVPHQARIQNPSATAAFLRTQAMEAFAETSLAIANDLRKRTTQGPSHRKAISGAQRPSLIGLTVGAGLFAIPDFSKK